MKLCKILFVFFKIKQVPEMKDKVNESLSAIQGLIDKNKLSIGSKISGPLRSKVINIYTNGWQ